MLSKGSTSNMPKKGKAVQVEHHLFDELWNSGSRQMPTEVKITNTEGQEEEKGEEEKQEDDND